MIPFYTPLTLAPATYKMKLDIDDATLRGTTTILWTHTGDRPLQILQLKGRFDHLTIATHEDCKIEQDGDTTLITLKEPLLANEKVGLEVCFTTKIVNSPLCDGDGSVMMPEGERGQKWYPHLAWDVPVCGHFRVEANEPKGYHLCITGSLEDGVYTQDNANLFGLLLCQGLEYAEKQAGDVTIKAFYKKGNENAARILMNTSADAIDFYRGLMGFYPQRTYSFLPDSSSDSGGSNWATGIACFHSMAMFNRLRDDESPWIAAHELGHHYWGEYVTDGDYCGWLWIGLGLMLDEEYCVSRGLTSEFITAAEEILRYRLRGRDTTIWRPVEAYLQADQSSNDYNNIVRHNKSYCLMQMLKQIISKELLFEIMRYILREYAGRPLRTMDFWRICEEKSGMRLDWFFADYLYSDRIPGYEIASVTKNANGMTAEIHSFNDFKFPVWVRARSADGSLVRKQLNRVLDTQQVRFEIDPHGAEVILEAETQLILQAKEEVNALIRDIDKAGYEDDGRSLERYTLLKNQPIEERGLLYMLASQLFTGGHYNEAEDVLQTIYVAKRNYYRSSCIWLGLIADIKGQREQAVAYFGEALRIAPDGFRMQIDQLSLTVDKYWLEQHLHEAYIPERISAKQVKS